MTEEMTAFIPGLTRAALCRLVEKGGLTAAAWEESLCYLGFRPDARGWGDFWRHVLLLSGVLFLTAGVIFFIAWNWADMHRFTRLGLVQAVVAGTGLVAVWRGPDSLAGRLSLLACGICVGPMLAVFGQTYQTGAELWELFRVWAGVLLALALVGRQAALWLTAWIVTALFVMLYTGRSFITPEAFFAFFPMLPEYLMAQSLALVLWEAAARLTRDNPRHGWLHARWLPRLFFFALVATLTLALFSGLAFGSFDLWGAVMLYLPAEPTYWGLYALCLGGGWLWYRRRVPDLFMLTCGVGSLGVMVLALLVRARLFYHQEVFAFFAWGVILVTLTWGVGKILIQLQRSMEREFGEPEAAAEEKAPFFSVLPRKRNWAEVWDHLRACKLVSTDLSPPVPPAASSPWYVQVMLAFGGWVAALLFVVFLGLFLYLTLEVRNNIEAPLLLGSIILLFIAGFCLRHPAFFARRFGFAAALAGSGGAAFALCMLTRSQQHWPLLAAAPLAVGIPFMRSSSYRFLAALFLSMLLPLWFSSLAFGPDIGHFGRRSGHLAISYPGYLAATAVWWTLFALCLAVVFTREGVWRSSEKGPSRAEMVFPLAFGGYAGMLAILLAAFGLRSVFTVAQPSLLASSSLGLGAGAGFVFLVRHLTADVHKPALRLGLLALAALALPLGWYLPGVGAAVFGMGLARYAASSVMLGATGFFLFAYMIYYYYYLGLPLVHKSLTLLAVGVVLIAAGLGVKALTERFILTEGNRA